MKQLRSLTLLVGLGVGVACVEEQKAERHLSSFEVNLLSPVGTPDYRCPLPGTPTAAFNLTGCPRYEYDSSERTVARLKYSAKAIDNFGNLYENYNNLATVEVGPGSVEAAFSQVRFSNGIVDSATVSFRGAFGDTILRVIDNLPPGRSTKIAGMGLRCGFDNPDACKDSQLSCINTKPQVGFDSFGLAYCTIVCESETDCPNGYFCGTNFQVYSDYCNACENSNFLNQKSCEEAGWNWDSCFTESTVGACMRKPPSYATGVAGPMHMIKPRLADINRADSLTSSPFEDEFIEIREGHMIVTAIRVDGFYLTDICPLDTSAGGPTETDQRCSVEARAQIPEFNHLFVFNFSRPDDLYPGDRLLSVAGPMTEFVGLTEMGFPLWQIDPGHRTRTSPTGVKLPPLDLIPPAVDLHERLDQHYPDLIKAGERCFDPNHEPEEISLLDCAFALERLEAARVSVRVKRVVKIKPDSPALQTLLQFGQWPVEVETPQTDDMPFFIITRENLPFFDPIPLGDQEVDQTITGNLRQVAFDDRSDPLWILEPREHSDCSWCQN